MVKQVLYDVLIVLILPSFLVAGYLYLGPEQITSFLSFESLGVTSLPGSEGNELGTKTKAALSELNSIHFDKTLFADPVFLSLVDFTVPIATTTIGREYPFSTPDEVKALFNKQERGGVPVATSSAPSTPKQSNTTKKAVR